MNYPDGMSNNDWRHVQGADEEPPDDAWDVDERHNGYDELSCIHDRCQWSAKGRDGHIWDIECIGSVDD